MMRFTIFTYSTEGALDMFPCDVSREQLVGQATLVNDFLSLHRVDERELKWLMRALVAVPGLGIWPLMELRADNADNKSRRPFTAYVYDLVRTTMERIMFDEEFGHRTLTELTAHIESLRMPLVIKPTAFDPNITDLAEAVLAVVEAVRVIDKAYNCVLPNNLLGNLEQCQEKLKAMVVRR